jgi:hypothetical protein
MTVTYCLQKYVGISQWQFGYTPRNPGNVVTISYILYLVGLYTVSCNVSAPEEEASMLRNAARWKHLYMMAEPY